MSRAGCRWDEDSDEREVRRLQLKKENCEHPTRVPCKWTEDDEVRLKHFLAKQPVKP